MVREYWLDLEILYIFQVDVKRFINGFLPEIYYLLEVVHISFRNGK